MKEYICKEKLSEKVQGRVIFTHEIDELPIITKAHICREFGKEVIKRFRSDSSKGFANIMSELLAEMESE